MTCGAAGAMDHSVLDHKHGQAVHFDHAGSPEFEIHRPHGESRLYRFLMEYKFDRAVNLLPWPVRGRLALSVCSGSGMDAEFLERGGARVVGLDISHGALLRSRRRAHTYGLAYVLVRGDAEALPFRSSAFDVSFVHDGLHHLVEPRRAITEMARVARGAVVITEPADAALTKLAIALRIIPAREDSGNLVARFDAGALRELFCSLGFQTFRSARYLMKYGHPPGAWWRLLDHPIPFTLARLAFLALGAGALGTVGNKLSVTASRRSDLPPFGPAPAPAACAAHVASLGA